MNNYVNCMCRLLWIKVLYLLFIQLSFFSDCRGVFTQRGLYPFKIAQWPHQWPHLFYALWPVTSVFQLSRDWAGLAYANIQKRELRVLWFHLFERGFTFGEGCHVEQIWNFTSLNSFQKGLCWSGEGNNMKTCVCFAVGLFNHCLSDYPNQGDEGFGNFFSFSTGLQKNDLPYIHETWWMAEVHRLWSVGQKTTQYILEIRLGYSQLVLHSCFGLIGKNYCENVCERPLNS